ncbi:MAG: SIS domain-containing protein [Thermomicrobiales bacterium]|nr:SIS domain-containing protein [Thermomicrobiales bacterium]
MSTPVDQYFNALESLIGELRDQAESIDAAAEMIAETIANDGLVHVFGSGHSHMMAEEVFHRAGGLWAFNAMLDINLTAFGSLRPGAVERTEGYAKVITSSFGVQPGEVVIVVSNSGINAVPIELAMDAKALGARTIAVTSAAAYASAKSRHSSGKKLGDVVDLTIDSRVPNGDAVLALPGLDAKIGATSTALGAALMNAIVVAASGKLLERGVQPPAIVSMNVPGGDERNRELEAKYGPRLRMLKG